MTTRKLALRREVHDVDVVFDTVGGKTLERSWQVLRNGGKLVSVASQNFPQLLINFRHISKKKEIHMALMQRGLLFIQAGTNLSELEI